MIERIICSTVHLTLPRRVFQIIPAGFMSSYTMNEPGIYFWVSLSCHKTTPLTENRSALSFFLETTFFKMKGEKMILDSTMYTLKENRA